MKYKNYLINIRGYSESTISLYCKIAKELNEKNMIVLKMMQKYMNTSNNTKRVILSAAKSYLKFLGHSSYKDIELPKKDITVKPHVTYDEYKVYIKNINKWTKKGLQKFVIVRMLFETGIRSGELLKIRRQDINNQTIKISGKGKKERYVHISEWLSSDLEDYLKTHNEVLAFPFGYKNLYQKIRSLNKEKCVTPHMFRRGFAIYCNKKHVPLYELSLAMGHSDINTTAHYVSKDSSNVNLSYVFKETETSRND